MTATGARNNGNRREEEIAMRNSHPRWSAQQWLSACGHPGYSERFAQQVWADLISVWAERRGDNTYRVIDQKLRDVGR